MRQALAEGQTQARVRLVEAVDRPHAYGVGALEQLAGEVTIVDGRAWIAKSDGTACDTAISDDDHTSATLLAVAYVPAWLRVDIAEEVKSSDLGAFIRSAAAKHQIPVDKPFPFMITGRLDVDAHVVSGNCPHAGSGGQALEAPYRLSEDNRHGRVVGFFAENAAGSLTHHGECSHMHVLYDREPLFTGHIDRLTIHAGSTLYVPQGPSAR
jgi:acetolactate decarboxylase